MNRRVLVTGATGFIAAETIAKLLDAGAHVRGTVRKLSSDAVDALQGLPGSDRLELVVADLNAPESFHPAMEGIDAVLHMASPYVLDAKDPMRDLVEPAVNGTLAVLQAAAAAPSVKRVVLTSSMAAITDEPDSEKPLTEDDWNTKSSPSRNPYYFSKAEAERAAWRFRNTKNPSFDLVVINPFMVIGPSRVPGLNTSNQIFADLLNGAYPGIMRISWGFVDVRDVAQAHIKALETPSAKGRYLCAGETLSMREVVETLQAEGYGAGAKLPKMSLDCEIGDYVVKLASYTQPKGVGTYLRTHVGRVPSYDNGKIRRELGIEFRPARETIRDTLADLVRWGHVKAASPA